MSRKNSAYGILFVSLLFLLSACATKLPTSIASPFEILGEGASAYLVLPVQANRVLVDRITELIIETSTSNASVLDRTDIVYAGLYENSAVTLVARGNFPAAAASIVFPASKGWKKYKGASGKTWYQSQDLEATIPWNSMVLASSIGFIDGMLLRSTSASAATSSTVDPSFSTFADTALVTGTIGMYIPNAIPLVDRILGEGIEFPIQYIMLFAQPSVDGQTYTLSSRVLLSDERAARSLSLLLRVTTGIETSHQGSMLLLSNYSIPTEKLAELSLFFVN